MMYHTTFINARQPGDEGLVQEGRKHLESRLTDLRVLFSTHDCTIEDVYDYLKGQGNHEAMQAILEAMHEQRAARYDNWSDLNLDDIDETLQDERCNYGLCFDYVELGTFEDQEEDYFRYQFSWGGPSEELRFYANGAIEFVYLDWFVGVGFNLNRDDTAQIVREEFTELGMMEWEKAREESNYYETLEEREMA